TVAGLAPLGESLPEHERVLRVTPDEKQPHGPSNPPGDVRGLYRRNGRRAEAGSTALSVCRSGRAGLPEQGQELVLGEGVEVQAAAAGQLEHGFVPFCEGPGGPAQG